MTRFKGPLALGVSLLVLFAILLPLNEMERSVATVATAVPPTSRPDTPSCVVPLIQSHAFSTGSTPFTSRFSPPTSCPSPWLKVVLDWWGRIDGAQYDRVAGLWIGFVEIFRATTSLSLPNGVSWHVDKDVSEYSSLFTKTQNITAILPNVVASRVPGTAYVNASLTFFTTSLGARAPPEPDVVVPIFASPDSPWFSPRNSSEIVGSTMTLPRNIVRASLEIYATAHSPCDEFWYAPDLTGCGGLPFREVKVFIDGTPAGIAWPFPIMYAGALNPSLWSPVLGIEALNISPYTVNLTPLVGLLTNLSPTSIGFQIANFMSSWRIDADLLLYLDPSVATTSGAFLSETLPTNATTALTTVVDSAQVNQTTTATRVISLLGYVNSSSGHALANVRQVMTFNNQQILDLIGFTGHVIQTETIATIISVSGPVGVLVQMTNETYSLNFSYNTYLPGILGGDVDSALTHQEITLTDGTITQVGSYSDAVHASTLGPIPWISGEETTELYRWFNCATYCPNSTKAITLSTRRVVGERINVGLIGSELVALLFLVGEVKMSTNRRNIARRSFLLGGYFLVAFGLVFSYLEYVNLETYHLTILQFLESQSPEILVTGLGVSFIVTKLALGHGARRSEGSERFERN